MAAPSLPHARGFHLVPTLGLVSSRSAPHHQSLKGQTERTGIFRPVFGVQFAHFCSKETRATKRKELVQHYSASQSQSKFQNSLPYLTPPQGSSFPL